jgi:hypothetical protein
MRSTTRERLEMCRRVQGLPAIRWPGEPREVDELTVRWNEWRASRRLLVRPQSALRSRG